MEPVVGIFPSRSTAERAVAAARARGVPFERIQLLLPETAPEDVSVALAQVKSSASDAKMTTRAPARSAGTVE